MTNFEQAFNKTVLAEGGYSNNPFDKGGKTMFGITEQTARANGYQGEMKDMPLQTAKNIYQSQYWDINKLDSFHLLISEELFDTGANQSPAHAATYLQQSLNRLNSNGKYYPDIDTFGFIGNQTIANYNAYITAHKKLGFTEDKVISVLLKAINICQGERYNKIVDADKTQENFYFGWIGNRVAI